MFASQEQFRGDALKHPVYPVHTLSRKEQAPAVKRRHEKLDFSSSKRRILAATFNNVRRYRDFCRIEAIVTVTFQYHPSLPVHTERLLTSVPYSPIGQKGNFRQRLIESAINLAVLMHRSERGGTLRPV